VITTKHHFDISITTLKSNHNPKTWKKQMLCTYQSFIAKCT